jgi:beta-xylosidase
VKSVDISLQFGIPNMVNARLEEGIWFNRFLEFCVDNECPPDFMGYNFHAIIFNNIQSELASFRLPQLSMNPNALKDSILTVKSRSAEFGWNVNKLYLPLWNYCFSSNPLEDTTFRAVYIIKNYLENANDTDGLGCGTLYDNAMYSRMAAKTYYGFRGLFTGNGIPKAAYYAFTLLARLGDQMIASGEGWYITKKGNDLQLLFYYYEHFSEQYANSEYFATTNSERYLPFAMDTRLKITVPLTDLPYDKYLSTETMINRASGSSFDKWLEMGALPVETPEMIEYLSAVSTPRIVNHILEVQDGFLEISVELEPLEIRMIELRPN